MKIINSSKSQNQSKADILDFEKLESSSAIRKQSNRSKSIVHQHHPSQVMIKKNSISKGYEKSKVDNDMALKELTQKLNDLGLFEEEKMEDFAVFEKIRKNMATDKLEWNEDLENQYNKIQWNARQLFFDEASGTHWRNIGLVNIVQANLKEYKKSQEKNHIMTRYKEGDWLTSEELKFLVNTSNLLNSCLDKKYFQNIVNSLDNKILHFVINDNFFILFYMFFT